MFSILIIAIITAAGLFSGYFLFSLKPASESSFKKIIEIEKGDSFNQIVSKLAGGGLIKSQTVFKIYSILSGSAHLLKPGVYVLNPASSTPAIVHELVKSSREEVEVLIQEGLTFSDIDYKLSSAGILPKGSLLTFNIDKVKSDYEFLKTVSGLEGYLFPDTYKFFKNSEPAVVVRKFLDNFKIKIWPIIKNCQTIGKCHNLTPHQTLTMASLIEREAPAVSYSEDRRIISGILYRRLSLGMPLQVDATITYAKCSGSFLTCDKLIVSKDDLFFESLYNTYLHLNLPPGPIANVGINAVETAINPKNSDYMYYLSEPKNNKIIFSKTLDEHNKNRVKYLNI